MTAATAPAPTPSLAASVGKVVGALARKLATRVVKIVRAGGASAVGVAGLASIAVGAGMIYVPAGFIVGGVLAVWLASLLPGGAK